MATYTLAKIVAMKDAQYAGIIDDCTKVYPLINQLPAISIPGITYSHPVIGSDATGEFREANVGRTASSAGISSNAVTLKYFDCSMGPLDVLVARANTAGVEAAIAVATASALRGGLGGIEKQVLYGTANDANGFVGLKALCDSSMVVDAQGTATGACSSVFLCNFEQVQLILGNDGILSQGEVMLSPVSIDNKIYNAYTQDIATWCGITGIAVNGVGMIKNLDTTAVLTDDMIYDAISKFAVGHAPSAIVMSRRSAAQLRKSRTATNATGAPAPMVTEVEGIPVIITDSVINTEAAA